MSTLMHEINSPAVSIKLTSRRLVNQRLQLPPSMIASELRDIADYSDLLVWLYEGVSHLLKSATERRADYNPKRFNLRKDVSRKLLSLSRPLAREFGRPLETIRITFPNLVLHGDRNSILLALINLLRNALKYSNTDQGKLYPITVIGNYHPHYECRVCKRTYADIVLIKVFDYGIGVPEGSEDAIFEPGVRLENARRIDMKGIGVGLSLVKLVMTDHDGCIHLTSNEEPTIFAMIIPGVIKENT